MPCSPNDVTISTPDGPSGPPIPGFGTPGALKLPDISPFPEGFPEDLLDILNKLQFLIPPGTLKPALNPNFGKDVFDGIMKLMDQFFPFLMLYKFFLPVLNIIVCIIEVLCAIPNPYKLIRAITRLFRRCVPEFLNMFPMFAIIVMVISLLQLLITLIEYIIAQALKFSKAILRNVLALNKAYQEGNANSVLAIAKKLGSLLCIFQNLFVLLSLFSIVFQVIKDILSKAFAIPPCDDGNNSDDGCCTPDVCPAIVKQPYTRTTGTLQYLNQISYQTSITLPPAFGGSFNYDVRSESWQIYDPNQTIAQQFINIIDAYDVTSTPKPVFFPTDVVYSATTAPKQAAYTIDLRMFYNPAAWGRSGISRWIRFKDCIVTHIPSYNLVDYQNAPQSQPTGVLTVAGGLGYEDNNTTVLHGFASDGVTPISAQATLQNFIHMQSVNTITPIFHSTDGYAFHSVEYTFKPNINTLVGKNIITLGCAPDLALNKAFINNIFAGDAALNLQEINNILNGVGFPDPNKALECLNSALSGLRTDLTANGVATFQSMLDVCLNKLKNDANKSLVDVIRLGVDPCNSVFTIAPSVQFTSQPINVKVELKDRNKMSLSTGLSADVGKALTVDLKGYPTLGTISKFAYDGYQYFTAQLTSKDAGKGTLSVSFDNNVFCINTIPTDITIPPKHELIALPYEFIYTSSGTNINVSIGDESDGLVKPRRDDGDMAREYSDNSGKDGT